MSRPSLSYVMMKSSESRKGLDWLCESTVCDVHEKAHKLMVSTGRNCEISFHSEPKSELSRTFNICATWTSDYLQMRLFTWQNHNIDDFCVGLDSTPASSVPLTIYHSNSTRLTKCWTFRMQLERIAGDRNWVDVAWNWLEYCENVDHRELR